MARHSLDDLQAFLEVARERSFTRAAAKLGVSPSALSHSMRGLEERLGLRLLSRTTRSVTPTDAGERLLQNVGPRFEQIEAELAALGELRERPGGSIRITADEHALSAVLWPALCRFAPRYPDIKIEIMIENGLTDIVAERFDAGVRLGGTVAKDMVALRIGPDERMAVVAAPGYLSRRVKLKQPQDLTEHACINFRLPTRGNVYAWEFEKKGREFRVRVDGQLMFNAIQPMLRAALDGFGVAYLPEGLVKPFVDKASSCGYWPTGRRRSPDTISTIRAVASRPPPSPCCWKHCVIGESDLHAPLTSPDARANAYATGGGLRDEKLAR